MRGTLSCSSAPTAGSGQAGRTAHRTDNRAAGGRWPSCISSSRDPLPSACIFFVKESVNMKRHVQGKVWPPCCNLCASNAYVALPEGRMLSKKPKTVWTTSSLIYSCKSQPLAKHVGSLAGLLSRPKVLRIPQVSVRSPFRA